MLRFDLKGQVLPVWSAVSPQSILHGLLSVLLAGVEARSRARVTSAVAPPSSRVLLTDSGTTALQLAIRGTATGAKRPVALPAFACFDIATAVHGSASQYLFYDIDPTTLAPDADSLSRALERGADRVVVVHHYGVPVDIEEVARLSQRHGAVVIEDAAQGDGARWRGAPLGRVGSLGVLSFGRGKGVSAGSGGALVGNDDLGRRIVDELDGSLPAGTGSTRVAASLLAQVAMRHPLLYQVPAAIPQLGLGETTYREPSLARGMSALAVGVLSRTLDLAFEEAGRRREVAKRTRAALRSIRGILPSPPEGGEQGYLRLPLLLRTNVSDAELKRATRLGIMRSYPRSLPTLTAFSPGRLDQDCAFPGAAELTGRLITLPVHSRLRRGDFERIVDWCSVHV